MYESSYHYLLMSNHLSLQKKIMAVLKPLGLSTGQPKVLDHLRYHNGASQKDIAHACHIEPASLTSILNRMEEKGLIERKMLNGNRRTFHIFMTESGKKNQKLVEENFEKIGWQKEVEDGALAGTEGRALTIEALKIKLDGLSEEEQKVFMEIFLRIYRNLAEIK